MKNFTASLFIKEQGDLYRSEQTGELDYWEEQRENNVLLFCQPVSKYNIPPRLLRRYLKKHLTRLILDGKRNFIFMEHNLASKPCTFTDIAFELLTEKKQEYAVQIWGVSYAPYIRMTDTSRCLASRNPQKFFSMPFLIRQMFFSALQINPALCLWHRRFLFHPRLST